MARFYCSEPACPRRWESRTIADEHPKCCGKPMTQLKKAKKGHGVGVIPDVPEHYNVAFDTVVRSRHHLRQLQRDTGSVDYEPSRAQKERDAHARDRMKFEANRR